MLARAAEDLFWMGRYVERAENTARLLAAILRSAMLSGDSDAARQADWQTPLAMSATINDFAERHDGVSEERVLAYMILDRQNPASIRSCLACARENARASRHLLTSDLWESLNQTWLVLADLTSVDLTPGAVGGHLEWVRDRSLLFRGVLFGSMRRGDAFYFTALGAALERADNTARLLRARWPALSRPVGPRPGAAGRSGTDYYRAAALLSALSAYKAYREIYSSHLEARRIAELLILRRDMPRSLRASLDEVVEGLAILGAADSALGQARELVERLDCVPIDDLVRMGLDTFLTDVVDRTAALGFSVERNFMMMP